MCYEISNRGFGINLGVGVRKLKKILFGTEEYLKLTILGKEVFLGKSQNFMTSDLETNGKYLFQR